MQIGDFTVKPTMELIEFLKFNDFTYEEDLEHHQLDNPQVIVVNVIKRHYFRIDEYYIGPAMAAEEFLKKINHPQGENIVYEKLFTDKGKLLYEGYTLNGKPYGLGRLYFDNGNIYQEGVFDIKGIKMGKEHYYNGQVKFEGEWSLTYGYGPNAPRCGNAYDENGRLKFTGKFHIKKGGVGWPMIKYPSWYRNIEKKRPKIEYSEGMILKISES